jgi:hypothetical protein
MLDGTDIDFTKQKSEEDRHGPKYGKVVQVYENLNNTNSNFECDVVIDAGTFEERAVPYNGSHSGQIAPPKVGDSVLVIYREGENSKPVLMQAGYTNRDRSPLARSGMYRDVYESWQPEETDDEGNVVRSEAFGPAGRGDIKLTGYTLYDKTPSLNEKEELVPERTWFQISKEKKTPDPSDPDISPMVMEMYDSVSEDEAHIELVGNIIDNDDTKSLDMKMDFKEGTAKTTATNETSGMTTEISQDVKNDVMNLVADDGTDEYTVDFDPSVPSITIQNTADETGFKLNFDTGSFKILGAQGHGIESDGSGNFTWHHESIDFSEGTTTSL